MFWTGLIVLAITKMCLSILSFVIFKCMYPGEIEFKTRFTEDQKENPEKIAFSHNIQYVFQTLAQWLSSNKTLFRI